MHKYCTRAGDPGTGLTLRSAAPRCPVPAGPGLADLAVFRLTNRDRREWFPPPLTEDTIAAIYRHLVAGGQWNARHL